MKELLHMERNARNSVAVHFVVPGQFFTGPPPLPILEPPIGR